MWFIKKCQSASESVDWVKDYQNSTQLSTDVTIVATGQPNHALGHGGFHQDIIDLTESYSVQKMYKL